MTGDGITPSTHVDDIARLLSDEGSCPHSVWSGSRCSGPGRAVVRETAGRLEKRGDDVFPAFRKGFEATGTVSGARIAGRPDIIARHADGSVTVNDVRTGEPEAMDEGPGQALHVPSAQVQPWPVAREQDGRVCAVRRWDGEADRS